MILRLCASVSPGRSRTVCVIFTTPFLLQQLWHNRAAPSDQTKGKTKGKEKDKPKSERWAEAVRFEVAPLISGATNDRQSSPSPDGKTLAFRRGRGDIMMMDLASREVRTVREGWDPEIDSGLDESDEGSYDRSFELPQTRPVLPCTGVPTGRLLRL